MKIKWERTHDFDQAVIKIERKIAEATAEGVEAASDAIVEDIKDNWGKHGAPEIDTGNLNSSVEAERRDDKGRFAKKGTKYNVFIRADARRGKKKKTDFDYGAYLEYYAANKYPFIQPAIDRAKSKGYAAKLWARKASDWRNR